MPGRTEGRRSRNRSRRRYKRRSNRVENNFKIYENRTGLMSFFFFFECLPLENKQRICAQIEWLLLAPVLQKQLWGRILVLKVMMILSMSVQFIGK